MTDLIVGYGEVGAAIAEICGENGHFVRIHDPYKSLQFEHTCEVLHICFPYSDDFVGLVEGYIARFKPEMVIIHSTVKVGTTDLINDDLVVYSFVRGKHPTMKQTMRQHIKYVGGSDPIQVRKAIEYLQDLGFTMDANIWRAKEIEFAKLWDTTYYGICIAATKLADRMAKEYWISEDLVKEISQSYNYGVSRVGHSEWQRPILDPIPGPIGGHCVVPNAKILDREFPNEPLLRAIIDER